ncbi:MAG: YrhK family protein [Desulfosarcina sp.]|nr:YrhK family protein [Desulfobacterales bacterium]
MPHMFTNRPRLHDLTQGHAALSAQFRWETINAVLYKIGGFVFILGSILFFPRFEAYADIGAWTFFGGSLLYLVVTVHDLAEVRHHWRTIRHHGHDAILEYTAAASYVWGTVLFTVGSIFFLSAVGWLKAGAWCFVIGSLLFVLGASINVLQIVKSSSIKILQLMNLTAISFVVGAVLFTVASVPYLWDVATVSARKTLYAFLAAQYLVGSVLFFLGGVFNYWRAYVFMRDEIGGLPQGVKGDSDGGK